MASHKSAIKRIRANETRHQRNKLQHKITRTAVKKLRGTTDKKVAAKLLSEVVSLLDKLAKKNIIHNNKAANLKSSLTGHVNSLK